MGQHRAVQRPSRSVSKGQALAEVTRGEASKKDNDYSERLIWKGDALHQIQPAMKQDTVWPISREGPWPSTAASWPCHFCGT